jgi:ATP-binding cassette subfamily F protein 3
VLTVSNLSLHFGGRTLFDGITFQIVRTDRIGLVGRNGAGKSTLLKVLTGFQKQDNGDISTPKGFEIGYLPQDINSHSTKSIYEETKTAFSKFLALENELKELSHQMETRTDYDSDSYMDLITLYGEKDTQFHMMGSHNIDEEIEKILKGLGFEPKDMQTPVNELSGGWQMRIELAKILLQKPDLILFDEPTNHLDIHSITWLENFLRDYDGAILLISHDKAFLNNVTNRTIEIFNGDIDDYKANYSKYIDLRKERKENQINAKKNQEREIRQIERNIERFRAKASKAAFAQSLVKKLDKIDIIEVDAEDVSKMNIRFPDSIPSGKIVLEVKNASKKYGDKTVIHHESFYIDKGDRIAFVGKNGMGKTTLSRMIAGDLTYEGEIKMGYNVHLGYYAQHQAETLDGNKTVFETIDEAATGEMRTKVRTLLGCFLFSGEDVEKKVKVLSGGEKGRVAMAKLLLEPMNLLILDEPTNHLDMVSKETLKLALKEYKGTLILVSHDRDFLQGLTNRIMEFTDQGIKEHVGDIYDFLEAKKAEDFRAYEQAKNGVVPLAKLNTNVAAKKTTTAVSKPDDKEAKALKNKASKLENQIAEWDNKIEVFEKKLKDPVLFKEVGNDPDFYKKYDAIKQEQLSLMKEWEMVLGQIG